MFSTPHRGLAKFCGWVPQPCHAEVVEARKVFGNPDYFLRIVVRDAEEYEQFQMQRLTALPAVFRVDSHQTMKLLKR